MLAIKHLCLQCCSEHGSADAAGICSSSKGCQPRCEDLHLLTCHYNLKCRLGRDWWLCTHAVHRSGALACNVARSIVALLLLQPGAAEKDVGLHVRLLGNECCGHCCCSEYSFRLAMLLCVPDPTAPRQHSQAVHCCWLGWM